MENVYKNGHNPFQEVTPLEPLNENAVHQARTHRSMLWDLIGPVKMQADPQSIGQFPASVDVLEKEYQDMMQRKIAVSALNPAMSSLAFMASEAASQVILGSDPKYKAMTDEMRMEFRMHHVNYGSAVVDTVIGHLIQEGLVHIGANT